MQYNRLCSDVSRLFLTLNIDDRVTSLDIKMTLLLPLVDATISIIQPTAQKFLWYMVSLSLKWILNEFSRLHISFLSCASTQTYYIFFLSFLIAALFFNIRTSNSRIHFMENVIFKRFNFLLFSVLYPLLHFRLVFKWPINAVTSISDIFYML